MMAAMNEGDLKTLIDALHAQAVATRQRRLLVIAGDEAWCRDLAEQVVAFTNLPRVSWISNIEVADAEVLSVRAAQQLLGQERDVIVFDAHAGFDADAFGAVSGVIPGGGVLLLLCPPMSLWAAFPDPAAERIAVWPYSFADIGGRFIQRLVSVLQRACDVLLVEQDAPLSVLPPLHGAAQAEMNDAVFRSPDQCDAVKAIEQIMHEAKPGPRVLVADRGRGKTAALGIAAAHLLSKLERQQKLRILVTAPRPAAVQPLFDQVQNLLPEATTEKHAVHCGSGSVEFIAPDVLTLSTPAADLLLVDEAAAIPASLLQQFLHAYPRIVFSTTTHGYEGTGRGFAVRFRQTLDAQTPGWSEQRLHTPIRWAADDPLERFVFDALLLAADSAEDAAVVDATIDNVNIERIDRDTLLNDETLLSQLFGLLVVAHYRTRPTDLRNLLDGPGLSVYVARYQGQVVATALVSREGGFDADLSEAIFAGRRRPRGHLLPQSLSTHCGIQAAAGLQCARVMRIAVHPVLQGQGLGRQLLRHIKDEVQTQGADLFGASFGATESLLHFWSQENVLPVRIGFRRGHSSGEYSLMVLSPLSAAGESVFKIARARFVRDLPYWLADPLRELETGLASALQQHAANEEAVALSAKHDEDMLHSFVHGERTYEDALGPMYRLLEDVTAITKRLQCIDERVLQSKVIEKNSWAKVAQQFKLAGKAEVLACLRSGVSQRLSAVKTNA